MADEQNPNTDTTNTQAAPAQQPGTGSPQITPEIQAMIDAAKAEAAQQAKNAAWAEARRTFEAKQKQSGAQAPQTQAPKADAPASSGQDAMALIKLRDDFDDAVGDLSLTGAQKKFLRDMVMEKRPDDVGGYVSNFVQLSGWKAAGSSNPATPAPESPAPKTHSGPPVTGSGAPANPTNVVTDDTPILRLSEDARKALLNRIGPAAYVERMRKEFRTVRVRG
jgi:hypothetical protein